jgi:protein-S-isoprenylcysteine O-methyltransferase Ste14
MTEIDYKYCLAFLLILSAMIRGVYEIKYKKTEKIIAYFEGRERFFVIGVGFFLSVPAVVYLLTDWLDFFSITLTNSWRIFGILLMFANVLFFLWVHISLGNNWSPIVELNKTHILITQGPYKYIRHPMYASIFIHCIALWLVTANIFIGLCAFLSFAIIYPFRIKSEEKMMIDKFGDEYKNYIKKTGRLFPKIF